MRFFIIGYLSLVVVISVTAFVAYGIDKRQATRERWRISERNLQLFALLGGWPGALVGQRLFRHKTQKRSFLLVFWLMVVIHLSIVGGIAYLIWKAG